ncbi:MAG: PilZ domain-containing protein [Fimbriimonadaceae bacterium]|nr:MAG: PilZ domain-containing protein [Fimbriimonadaceae bacterium]
MNASKVLEIGDTFRMEANGQRGNFIFEATLQSVEQLDMGANGVVAAIEGTSARLLEARMVTLVLMIGPQPRYAPTPQPFRIRVTGIDGMVNSSGSALEASLLDVSSEGFALFSKREIRLGDTIRFEIATPLGMVRGDGQVMNCRPAPDHPGFHRVGVKVIDLGRLDAPRWARVVQEY